LRAIEGKNPPVSPFAKGGLRGIEKEGQKSFHSLSCIVYPVSSNETKVSTPKDYSDYGSLLRKSGFRNLKFVRHSVWRIDIWNLILIWDVIKMHLGS